MLPTSASLANYGGQKINFAPVEDPNTEYDQSELNQAFNDVAMMTRTAVRGFVRFTTSATTPAIVTHYAQWGNAAPVTPVVARTGTGVFTVTFPASVTDELGVSQSLLIRASAVHVEGNTFANSARCSATSSNVVTVYTAASGTAADIAGSTILVMIL
jgi:hypothetical protein